MNDSLRTDVFVRFPPETIAVACIYLSARKLKEPLPKNPSWFEVLGVEEDDIKECCSRMISLYNIKKANQEDLERTVKDLRERRKAEKEARDLAASALNTPSQSSPNSRAVSPVVNSEKVQNGNSKNGKESTVTQDVNGARDHNTSPLPPSRHKKKHKHKNARSRSRSPSYDDYKRKKKKRSSRTPSLSPPVHKKSKHDRRGHHRDHHHHK